MRGSQDNLGPSGFLPVVKPSGMTSFDVIRRLRRILGIRKLGHSGVLDKPASGVLVVGLNRATRLFELFGEFEKQYLGDVWFGLTTDTNDLTGELADTYPVGDVTLPRIEAALAHYSGEIAQIPPNFSLTKKAGRELYRYALAGQEVEVEPKLVNVIGCEALEFEAGLPASALLQNTDSGAAEGRLAAQLERVGSVTRARLRIRCTGGMYIRALARDLGADLGIGATLGYLVRTQVGPFRLEDSHTLEELEQRADAQVPIDELIRPLSVIAPANATLDLDSTQVSLVRSGRNIRRFRQQLPAAAENPGDTLFGLDHGRQLVAVLSVQDVNPHGLVELRPVKVIGQ